MMVSPVYNHRTERQKQRFLLPEPGAVYIALTMGTVLPLELEQRIAATREQLLAAVRRRSGSTLTEDQVRDYCRARLAHYKVPRYVRFVEEYPMTSTGKIQKFKLRAESIELLDLHAAADVRHA